MPCLTEEKTESTQPSAESEGGLAAATLKNTGKAFSPGSQQAPHNPRGNSCVRMFTAALFVFKVVFHNTPSLFQLFLVEMTRGEYTVFGENTPLQPLLTGNIHVSFQVTGEYYNVPCAPPTIHFVLLLFFSTNVDDLVFWSG